MSLDFGRQRRSELLNPAEDRPPADVDPPVGKDAGDAFGRGTQLQVVPDSQQDDIQREAMASDEAHGLAAGVAATSTAGVNDPTTLVVAIESEIG